MRLPPVTGPWLPVACLWFLVACSTPAGRWRTTWDAPHASFSVKDRNALGRARDAMDSARYETAWRELAVLAEEDPRNLEVGMIRQDVEIAWLSDVDASGELQGELTDLRTKEDPVDALRALYLQRARNQPSTASRVLAARLESDALAALNLLEQVLEEEPECAHAHYGVAYFMMRMVGSRDRWARALSSLDRALELDPGNPRFRRLEAWMLSQVGGTKEAAAALETWVENTENDPRVDGLDRRRAMVDLAAVWILRGREERALKALRELEGSGVQESRRWTLVACAEEALGHTELALEAARAAEAAGGIGLLPMIQQGQLLEELDRDSEAQLQWQRVVDASVERGDLASLLQSVRARVQLERIRPTPVDQGAEP